MRASGRDRSGICRCSLGQNVAMKLTIIRPLRDWELRLCSEQPSDPINLWFNPPEPKPVDLTHLRKILAYAPSMKVACLPVLIGNLAEDAVKSMIQRGDDYIVNYYTEKKRAETQAALEQERKRRQSSLMFWGFRNKLVKVEGWETASREEIVIKVKHKVCSAKKRRSRS